MSATALLLALALAGPAAGGPPSPGDFAPSENVACRDGNPVEYPRKLRRERIGGTVLVRVTIDAAGSIRAVAVEQGSGHPGLDAEAMRGVLRWCFWPGREGHRLYGGDVLVPVKFTP